MAGPDAASVLVFAGGWGVEGNQASIEADAERLLNLFSPRPHFLFGRGDRSRTVQIAGSVDPVEARLGLIFGSGGSGLAYRRPRLAADGPATPEAVLSRILKLADSAQGGVVFGAGHGRKDEGQPGQWELWGGPLDAVSLARALDEAKLPGPLSFVLGQCHSGAFMQVAFVGGEAASGLARPTRCVLAAAPPELEAAGCSPDAGAPGAQAFLSAFARGLEVGADYDLDGQTTLDEAFAFARIEDTTVDVPVRSSELWLAERDDPSLASLSGTQLRAWAAPADRAVLRALEPTDPSPQQIEAKLRAQIAAAERVDAAIEEKELRFEALQSEVREALLAEWPELAHPLHPRTRTLIAGDAKVLMTWLDRSADARRLARESETLGELGARRWEMERAIARRDRWVRTAKAVVGARRLKGQDLSTWSQLRACEQRTLRLVGREALRRPQ